MSAIYPSTREAYLTGQLDWLADDIVVLLCGELYDYDEAHAFISDVTDIIATSAPLTGKTAALGVADADDVIFPTVAPDQVFHVIVAHSTGVQATSRVAVHYNSDTASAEISLVTNGSDVRVTWSNGPLKIFRL